jgi:nucleotide-binding universal stress UspA family protein
MSIFPSKILLATDGSEVADLAAKSAATLAQSTNSELHVVHVGPGLPLYELPDYSARFEEVVRAQREAAQKLLDEQVRKIEGLGATVGEAHLEMDEKPDMVIVELGEKLGAGLVVVGSRGLGRLRRALMGSVSSSVVHHAHCSVMVVRGEALAFPTKLLLATDGSEDADLAANTALELSKRFDSELHAVYVEPMPERHSAPKRFAVDLPPEVVESVEKEAKTKLEKLVEKMREEGGEVRQGHARVGLPAAEIVILAEELGAGLILVGSRGLGGIRRALIGSVSDSVVRHAHCPVLVVRTRH